MFKAEKDERLQQIETESAAIAFIVNVFVIMGIMITKQCIEVDILSNPDFLLVAPWLFSGMVFLGMEGVMLESGVWSEEEKRRILSETTDQSGFSAHQIMEDTPCPTIPRLKMKNKHYQRRMP